MILALYPTHLLNKKDHETMQAMFTVVGYGAARSRAMRQDMLSWLLGIAEASGNKCQKFLLHGRPSRLAAIIGHDLSNESVEAFCRDKDKPFLLKGYRAAIDLSPYHFCLAIDSQSIDQRHLFTECVSQGWACYCIGTNIPLECAPTLYGGALAFVTEQWVGREYRESVDVTNNWSDEIQSPGFCDKSSLRNVYEYNYCEGKRLSRLSECLPQAGSVNRKKINNGEIVEVPDVEERLLVRKILFPLEGTKAK